MNSAIIADPLYQTTLLSVVGEEGLTPQEKEDQTKQEAKTLQKHLQHLSRAVAASPGENNITKETVQTKIKKKSGKQRSHPNDGHHLNIDKSLRGSFPKMPPFLVCIPWVDKNLDPAKRLVVPPGLNIIFITPMHNVYDEAETMAVKTLLQSRFYKEQFFRGFSQQLGYWPIKPVVQTVYENVLVWPIKVHAIYWAAGRKSAARYLNEVFGALEYSPPNDPTKQRVSLAEAFSGPLHLILNNAMAGTMLAQMVRAGSTNPTIVLGGLNGPITDPTVSSACTMAASLNIPVALWKDDTQSGYGATDNPMVMAASSNQSVMKSYNNSNPLRMYQGLGNFRWVGPGGDDSSCDNMDPTECAIGNAFGLGYAGMANTYSWMNIVANPVQGVIQEKSHEVLYTPTLMDRLKQSIWYGLANTQATRGANKYISYPIPRDCDTAKCSKYGGQGPQPISLPFSGRYAKLLAFGSLLLDTLDSNGKSFQTAYEDLKDLDHAQPTFALFMGQYQWRFIIRALKTIYNPDETIFYNNLNYYFDPNDLVDVAFLIKFIVLGGLYDENGKMVSAFVPPSPIKI